MRVGELIEKLKGLDPKEEAAPWLKGYANSRNISKLSILDAGRAIKALVPIIGKPYITANKDQSGKWMSNRVLIWKGFTDVPATIRACSILLEGLGIKDYEITDCHWFKIRIPSLAQFRDFLKSDDPAIWQKNYESRIEEKRQLDLSEEEREKERQEGYKRDAAEWERNRPAWEAEEKRKKEEAELKIFEEVKEKLLTKQKAAIVTVKQPVRAIEITHD